MILTVLMVISRYSPYYFIALIAFPVNSDQGAKGIGILNVNHTLEFSIQPTLHLLDTLHIARAILVQPNQRTELAKSAMQSFYFIPIGIIYNKKD